MCCICTWMNEYLVHIISATRLQVVLIYSHNKQKKTLKFDRQEWNRCTERSLSLCLQTSRNHMEYKSLITIQKTSFYTGNTTSAFIIVVFLINCLRKFAISHVRCVVIPNCKLRTTQKQTAPLWNHQKHCMCSNPYIYLHYILALFFSFLFSVKFVRSFKNIFLIVQILL